MLKAIPYTQSDNRLLNQVQSYILNPLNTLISWFNNEPVISSPCTSFTTTSATYVNVDNLHANFTATGRPIRIELLPDGLERGRIDVSNSTNTSSCNLRILRDGTELSSFNLLTAATGATATQIKLPITVYSFVDDTASVGQHVYQVQVQALVSSTILIEHTILRISQD